MHSTRAAAGHPRWKTWQERLRHKLNVVHPPPHHRDRVVSRLKDLFAQTGGFNSLLEAGYLCIGSRTRRSKGCHHGLAVLTLVQREKPLEPSPHQHHDTRAAATEKL